MGRRRFPVLWVALLLGGAEGRVLNASCAAPETAVLQPAPPQHVESRLRPPTVRRFSCQSACQCVGAELYPLRSVSSCPFSYREFPALRTESL